MVTHLEDRGLKKRPKIADKIIENRYPFNPFSFSTDAIDILGGLLPARAWLPKGE
jgi:hypothetical protein